MTRTGFQAGTSFAVNCCKPRQPQAFSRSSLGVFMLDRQKVEAILRRRFTGTTDQQVAAAANAIMGLDDEREQVSDRRQGPGHWRKVVEPVGVIKGGDR